jgi:hypothetical protein
MREDEVMGANTSDFERRDLCRRDHFDGAL